VDVPTAKAGPVKTITKDQAPPKKRAPNKKESTNAPSRASTGAGEVVIPVRQQPKGGERPVQRSAQKKAASG